MKRKLYLEGEMADKFGNELTVNVDNIRDSFRLLEANFPEFRSYLISCAEKDIGFIIDVADKNIHNEEDLILPLQEGDITITAVPSGSKSGGAKILAAIAIIVLTAGAGAVWAAGGVQALGGGIGALQAGFAAAMTTKLGLAAVAMALNLAMTGIQQLMAPDPATDADEPTSYMFNGSEQNVIEGDPVPILYGELRVPGRPIAFSVINNSRTFGSGINYGIYNDGGNSAGAPTNYGLEIDYNSYQS